VGAPRGISGRAGAEDVERGDGEGEGPGLATRAIAAARGLALPRGSVRQVAARVQPSGMERRRVDGRFGRCRGCGQVHVFCGPCASVGACCSCCAKERRREAHRRANRAYVKTPRGILSNRLRQDRRRERAALNRKRVTDTISTQDPAPPTPPLPSSSEVEPARDTEVSTDEISNRAEDRWPAAGQAVRCARCGRVLSGRVRPSEWIPPRRARRAARQPRPRPS
jgi:hypothetical protein